MLHFSMRVLKSVNYSLRRVAITLFLLYFFVCCLKRNAHDLLFFQDWWNDLIHENNYKELDYSGKMVLLLDVLAMCSAVGDKALVFSQSIPTLDLIELYLSRLPRHGKRWKTWKKGKDWFRLVHITLICIFPKWDTTHYVSVVHPN
jgi:hypothetical protein